MGLGEWGGIFASPDKREKHQMDPGFGAAMVYAGATQNAFAILAKCLMENGALKPGQFPAAIRARLNGAEADRHRLDYQYFQHLAQILEDAEKNHRT
jgi:hypothetical protein